MFIRARLKIDIGKFFMLSIIIISIVFVGGIISLFRPILLIYLFASLPVLQISFLSSEDAAELRMVRVGSINLYATDFLLIILLIILIFLLIQISVFKIQNFSTLIAGPINKIILILFTWEVIIGFFSYQKGFHAQNILRQLTHEALMFLSVFIPQLKDIDIKKEQFYNFISISGVILVFSALWRYFVTHEVRLTSSGTLRAISGNAVIIILVPICYFLFYRIQMYGRNCLASVIVALMTIGIFLAGHRSGFIALFFVFCIWYFKSEHRKINFMFVPLWTGALGILFIFMIFTIHISPGKSFLGDTALRFKDTFDLENNTTVDRLDIWQYSLAVAKEKPLMGVASFPVYLRLKRDEGQSLPPSQTKLNLPPHNLFVDKLIHEGIIGVGLIAALLYLIFKQIRFVSISNKYYADFFTAYLLAHLLFSCFNTSFSDFTGRTYFFIILGFLNSEFLKNYFPQRQAWT